MIAMCNFILLLVITIAINCNCDSVVQSSFDAVNSTINVTNDDTMETHHTTCKITTERLVANAEATFTRVLTGACNSKIINERFDKMEDSINHRLNELKRLIVRGITKQWNYVELHEDFRDNQVSSVPTKNSLEVLENEFEKTWINAQPSPRQIEVERFNNSVHDIPTSYGQQKVYTYYWRILSLREKLLQWETGRSERSSTFYINDNGYAMYLRFTPKYFPDGTIFVSVGLTSGHHDYKLLWPFPLKIRIEILDLAVANDQPKDRSSRLWDPATLCSSYFWGRPGTFDKSLDNPECVGLSIPRQVLSLEENEKYVWNDSLLVKSR